MCALVWTERRLQDDRTYLFDLVRLRIRTCPLQIDLLLDSALPEQVMAAPHALLETQTLEQLAQIVKTDGRIGGAAEKPPERFLSSHSAILHVIVDAPLQLTPGRPDLPA